MNFVGQIGEKKTVCLSCFAAGREFVRPEVVLFRRGCFWRRKGEKGGGGNGRYPSQFFDIKKKKKKSHIKSGGL